VPVPTRGDEGCGGHVSAFCSQRVIAVILDYSE
jgi:hypothetical protein